MKAMKKITQRMLKNARQKARFEKVMSKIDEEWRDMVSHNASFKVGPPTTWSKLLGV